MSEPGNTVIVIDDDESVREGLDGLLRSVGLKVIPFESALEFLKSDFSKGSAGPKCIISDIKMPGRSGLDLQDELTRRGVEAPIIFITGHGDIPMSVRAIKAGAVEFLTKPFGNQDLLQAVQSALERDRSRREQTDALIEIRERLQALTPRERAVLGEVVAGRPNKQIAANLGVSEITVKVHRGRVMRKMGVRSLAELVRNAAKLGLP